MVETCTLNVKSCVGVFHVLNNKGMGFDSWLDFIKNLVDRIHKFHVVVMCAVCNFFLLQPCHFVFQDARL